MSNGFVKGETIKRRYGNMLQIICELTDAEEGGTECCLFCKTIER